MEAKIQRLITLGKVYMKRSQDPTHDLHHVERVAAYASRISQSYDLSEEETEALMLAVWWHDVSRTIIPRTSFILMYFFDDLLSACMLWFWTVRYGLFGKRAGIATRIIFCKSKTPLARIFKWCMSDRSKMLYHILEDADALDQLHIERLSILCSICTYSRMYSMSYKVVCRWWTAKDRLNLATLEAKEIMKELLDLFMTWVRSDAVTAHHISAFGESWTREFINRWIRLEQNFLTQTV